MCGTKKICHPEFKNVLPCGCCPCKSMFYFPGDIEPVSVADMMKYAKSKGWRLHLEPNPVPGAAPITISVEELPEQVSVDRRTRTVPKRTNNKTVVQKSNKRVQTQSERTKARKLKKRQLQHDEIAAKRANMNSTDSSTKTANEMVIDNPKQAIAITEPTEATSKTVNQKQRPKTHFRKTKKPGRA